MRVIRQCRQWASCPLCLRGEVGILNHTQELNRRHYELMEKEYERMGLKKPVVAAADGGVPDRAQRGDDWVLYPALMEFLATDSYEDGTPRRTATLTVFTDGGLIKASVNDRDNDGVAFVTSESIAALLVVLEDKLKASSLDWRYKQGGKRRRGK